MNVNEVDTSVAVYHSIRETAKLVGLSEYFLRQLQKEKKLPGIYSGKKYLVNVPSLTEQLLALEGNGDVDERR